MMRLALRSITFFVVLSANLAGGPSAGLFAGLPIGVRVGPSPAFARETFAVTYISAEHVYLDGGKADGLAVGARLRAKAKDGSTVDLEVVFAAEHSSSCRIVDGDGRIAVGDKTVLVEGAPATVSPAPSDTLTRATVADTTIEWAAKPKTSRPPSTLVSGGVSLVVYNWNDNTDANLDFTQTTGRVSLKARRLWGEELSFALRARVQYDRRGRDYRAGAGDKDWDNRIWEFSLGYADPAASVSLFAGRILPRRVGAAGYIDGLLGEWRFSEGIGVGVFGGRDPDWLYYDKNLSFAKGGGYVYCVVGSPDRFRLEEVAGAVGEYHGSDVNREFIVFQGRFGEGRRWGMDHTAELDVNRGWRREKSGSSVDLSNLFVNAWSRMGNRLRLSMRYDNRSNVWTLENKSLVDSLFDDRLRQGARIQLEFSPGSQTWTTAAIGYHKRSGDPDRTFSYNATVRRNNLLATGFSLGLQAAGFDGPLEKGFNYAAGVTRTFLRGSSAELSYGGYSYSAATGTTYRKNHWVELAGQADVGKTSSAGARVQYDSGDDISGFRVMLELGYRF